MLTFYLYPREREGELGDTVLVYFVTYIRSKHFCPFVDPFFSLVDIPGHFFKVPYDSYPKSPLV